MAWSIIQKKPTNPTTYKIPSSNKLDSCTSNVSENYPQHRQHGFSTSVAHTRRVHEMRRHRLPVGTTDKKLKYTELTSGAPALKVVSTIPPGVLIVARGVSISSWLTAVPSTPASICRVLVTLTSSWSRPLLLADIVAVAGAASVCARARSVMSSPGLPKAWTRHAELGAPLGSCQRRHEEPRRREDQLRGGPPTTGLSREGSLSRCEGGRLRLLLVILGLAVGSVKVVHVVVQGYHALLTVVCGNKKGDIAQSRCIYLSLQLSIYVLHSLQY